MKRPVGSILLGLFLLSQILLQGGRLWPVLPALGRVRSAPALWTPLLPTAARVSVTVADRLVLLAENGSAWTVGTTGSAAAVPLTSRVVSQELPGGVVIGVRLVRLAGEERIAAVAGARAWISPDGRAAAVYDPADRALWALVANDVRPRPLGAVDPSAPGGLAWSARGDRLAYLSGHPGHLWSWRVGSYAQEIGGAYGVPVAVRSDGGLVLTTRMHDAALYLPGVGVAVPAASGDVLSASPDGRDALLAQAGRVFLTDLESGRAALLPIAPERVTNVVWAGDDAVAVLGRDDTGHGGVLVATPAGGRRWLRPPSGASIRHASLLALLDGQLIAVFERRGVAVTYIRRIVRPAV